MCPVRERPFKLNPWQRAKYDLHQLFGDGRLRVEKPAAIMDDTGYIHMFLLLFFGEYQARLRLLIDKIAYICEVLTRTKIPDIIIIGLVH